MYLFVHFTLNYVFEVLKAKNVIYTASAKKGTIPVQVLNHLSQSKGVSQIIPEDVVLFTSLFKMKKLY